MRGRPALWRRVVHAEPVMLIPNDPLIDLGLTAAQAYRARRLVDGVSTTALHSAIC